MMTIGERIKTLRKKNNLTQEELADHLCVTYQAVSKWENGGSNPDFALIVPLAKIFHVTTDELLGADMQEDTKYQELQKAYDDTFVTGDLLERYKITAKAAEEYPRDMKWLMRHAWDIWCIAIEKELTTDQFEAKREKAIELFDIVIKNTNDDDDKIHAIHGIVQCLCGKGCKKEAKQYVEMYPQITAPYITKEQLLSKCLEGEDQKQQKQEILDVQLEKLLQFLLWEKVGKNADICSAAEGILQALIPDGNYGRWHETMTHIQFRKAEIEAKNNNGEKAIEYLEKAFYHAGQYDMIDSIAPGEYQLTAPLFDGYTFDSSHWFRTGNNTMREDIQKMCQRKSFDFLRESKRFQAIFLE